MKKYKYYLSVLISLLVSIDIFKSKFYHLVLRNGTKFIIRNFMDLWMITETYIRSDYEKCGIKIRKNWTIIDIGAALGDFSILAAQKSPSNKVFAIEPFPNSYNLLTKNIIQNHLTNISTYPFGIGSNNTISIEINDKNYGNNSQFGTHSTHTHVAKSITLNQFFIDNKIIKCNLLKIDCEGAEFDILFSTTPNTFSKINNIVMEYHLFSSQHKLAKLINLLDKNKFKVKITPNPVHQNIGFIFAKRSIN